MTTTAQNARRKFRCCNLPKNRAMPRRFTRTWAYQTGKKAGLREADMDGILSGLTSRVEEASAEVFELASVSGMPESTFTPILDGVRQRAGMIDPARVS
jgi:hypothetical protein